MNWTYLAILSAFTFGANIILIKYLTSLGTPTSLIMFYLYSIGAIFSFFYNYQSGVKLFSISNIIILLILVGLLSALGMITQIKAINLAPNPSYASAIISAQVVVTAIGATILLGSPLNLTKFLGIIITLAGVVIISSSNSQ